MFKAFDRTVKTFLWWNYFLPTVGCISILRKKENSLFMKVKIFNASKKLYTISRNVQKEAG